MTVTLTEPTNAHPSLAADYRNQELRKAVFDGNVEAVERLIAEGAEVNHDFFGCPLICLAAMNVVTSSHQRERLSIMKTLIEHGADVNSRDDFGWTPFDWAKCGVLGTSRGLLSLLENAAQKEADERSSVSA
jgi:ankyrin repeat protein